MNKTVHMRAKWSTGYTVCDERIEIDMYRELHTTFDPEKVTCEECRKSRGGNKVGLEQS